MPSNSDDLGQPFTEERPTTNDSSAGLRTNDSSAEPQTTDQPTANDQSKTDGSSRADGRNRTNGREVKERLRAVERAITDSDRSIPDISGDATAAAEREAIESRLDDIESRVEELEAATQAIRGYVGSIRAVNREVERRADLALSRASNDGEKIEMNDQDVASDNSGQRDDATTADVPTEDVPTEDVPSDAALNAALPPDRHHEEATTGSMSKRAEHDTLGQTGEDDGSWRDDALDRLRESL